MHFAWAAEAEDAKREADRWQDSVKLVKSGFEAVVDAVQNVAFW